MISRVVCHAFHTCLSRAVGTTIELQIGLDAVADDPATTLITVRR
jgi:hypothetical protein